MTSKEKLMEKLGLHKTDFEAKDNEADTQAALCELADMISQQEDAICELAELLWNKGE